VSYRERQRLADIQAAIDAIRSHMLRGGLSDGLVFDAVRIRLLEIGEAVKALPAELRRVVTEERIGDARPGPASVIITTTTASTGDAPAATAPPVPPTAAFPALPQPGTACGAQPGCCPPSCP